jgi:hypothetical protein
MSLLSRREEVTSQFSNPNRSAALTPEEWALRTSATRRVLWRLCKEIQSPTTRERNFQDSAASQVFVGSELIEWLLNNNVLPSQADAVVLLRLLAKGGFVDRIRGRSFGKKEGSGLSQLQNELFTFRREVFSKTSVSKSGWLDKVCYRLLTCQIKIN